MIDPELRILFTFGVLINVAVEVLLDGLLPGTPSTPPIQHPPTFVALAATVHELL